MVLFHDQGDLSILVEGLDLAVVDYRNDGIAALHVFIFLSCIHEDTLHGVAHLQTRVAIRSDSVDAVARQQVQVSRLVGFRVFGDWHFDAVVNEDRGRSLEPVLGFVVFTWVRNCDVNGDGGLTCFFCF